MIGLALLLAASSTGLSAGELFIRCTDLDPIWSRFCENTIKDIVAEPRKASGLGLDLQGVSTNELVREFTQFMRASPWRSPNPASDVVAAALLVKHRAETSQSRPRTAATQVKSRTATKAKSRAATSRLKARKAPRKAGRKKD